MRISDWSSDVCSSDLLCVQVGGTIPGEHGVGLEKINQLCVQFTRAELDFFSALTSAFDPYGLLNPEQVIPTLERCAEYVKLYVHTGEIRFTDLPRFYWSRLDFPLSTLSTQGLSVCGTGRTV